MYTVARQDFSLGGGAIAQRVWDGSPCCGVQGRSPGSGSGGKLKQFADIILQIFTAEMHPSPLHSFTLNSKRIFLVNLFPHRSLALVFQRTVK